MVEVEWIQDTTAGARLGIPYTRIPELVAAGYLRGELLPVAQPRRHREDVNERTEIWWVSNDDVFRLMARVPATGGVVAVHLSRHAVEPARGFDIFVPDGDEMDGPERVQTTEKRDRFEELFPELADRGPWSERPVKYGLLTAADVRELERRRATLRPGWPDRYCEVRPAL